MVRLLIRLPPNPFLSVACLKIAHDIIGCVNVPKIIKCIGSNAQVIILVINDSLRQGFLNYEFLHF